MGVPHPREEERASREVKVGGEAASRPLGRPPSAPPSLQQPHPTCVLSAPQLCLPQGQGWPHTPRRPVSSQETVALAELIPHTHSWSCRSTAQHSTEFTLLQVPHNPPSPKWIRAQRGLQVDGQGCAPVPRAGPDPWSAGRPAESAQHLLTGEGARDKLICLSRHPSVPAALLPSPSRIQPLVTGTCQASLTPQALPLARCTQCHREGAEAQLSEQEGKAATPLFQQGSWLEWQGLARVSENLGLEPRLPGSCLVLLRKGHICLTVALGGSALERRQGQCLSLRGCCGLPCPGSLSTGFFLSHCTLG